MVKRSHLLLSLLLFLTLTEGLLQAVVHVTRAAKPKNQMVKLSPYQNTTWAEDYFDELARSSENRYYPFIEWRRKEFHGRYIRVSEDGIRKTWTPGNKQGEAQLVYCFGGSTLWGSGARDEFTLPSLLSKKLNQNPEFYEVRNLGESAYTLGQEIVYLTLLLKEGQVPDYVIFYDGINDVFAGYQTGRPGELQNVEQIRAKLEEPENNFKRLALALQGLIESHYQTYRLLKSLLFRFEGKREGLAASGFSDEDLEQLSLGLVREYERDKKFVADLAKTYGFQYAFIWQPVLATNPSVTSEERQYDLWKDPKLVRFFDLTYRHMEEKKEDHFYNLSRILDSKEKTLYIDGYHLSEEGNEIVAGKLYQILKESVLK